MRGGVLLIGVMGLIQACTQASSVVVDASDAQTEDARPRMDTGLIFLDADPPDTGMPDLGFPDTGTMDADPPDTGPRSYTCTHVLGWNQTREWYTFSNEFERGVMNGQWQLQWDPQASVDTWSDPTFRGYEAPVVSRCFTSSSTPDRVILVINGDKGSNVDAWESSARLAVATVIQKFPSAQSVVLQPEVGGPDNGLCRDIQGTPITASVQHPAIDEAIARIARGRVEIGYSQEVGTCRHFRDLRGQLTTAGSSSVAASTARFYNNF